MLWYNKLSLIKLVINSRDQHEKDRKQILVTLKHDLEYALLKKSWLKYTSNIILTLNWY